MIGFNRLEFMEVISDVMFLIVIDLDSGKIVYATLPAERLFGYNIRGELVGKVIEDLIPQSQRAIHIKHRTSYVPNSASRQMGQGLKVQGLHRDGTVFPVMVSLSAGVISGTKCAIASITLP